MCPPREAMSERIVRNDTIRTIRRHEALDEDRCERFVGAYVCNIHEFESVCVCFVVA